MKIKSYKNGLIFGLGYFLIVLAIVWAGAEANISEVFNHFKVWGLLHLAISVILFLFTADYEQENKEYDW